jgi:integrase
LRRSRSPVRSVTRTLLVKFKDALLTLPSMKGGTLAPQSAVKDLNAIKSLLSYALQQGWIEANPGAGLSVAKGKGSAPLNGKSGRLPYETEEAKALLTNAAELPEGPQRYMPMILAYTGIRLAEAGGMRCQDVRLLDGVWCFSVEEHADRRIKTASSRRVVPVHSALVKAGLLDYVERQRASLHGRAEGHERVFPTLRPDAFANFGSAYGKSYGRWSRKIVPDRRKTLHSWRHTVATKLRQANVREDLMDELLGWTQTKMASRYGSGHTVQAKREAIERIVY